MNLSIIQPTQKTGQEPFHINGKSINYNLFSFWQWSNSNILGNALRGILAEYIVSLDIKTPHIMREEWECFDLITQDGVKIEVKSASYIQSWKQKHFSKISFSIQPTRVWEEDNKRSLVAKRQSDCYVFCLLHHKDQITIDPLNLDQWSFYVLATNTLDTKLGTQKTITLSSLLKLNPIKCTFGDINFSIKEVLK